MNTIAYVGKIISVEPIENSDFLNQAQVVCGEGGKWTGVVKKTDFKVGDLCEVYLPDALLPEVERFEFLRKNKFRIKQCRLRGAISEVLIMPNNTGQNVGTPIGDLLGVKKFEKPIDPRIAGDVEGQFPSFIPKTDEPNYQGSWAMVESLKGKQFFSTVKMDGSSGTFYKYNGKIGACSRNLELKETEHSLPWVLAKKYKLPELLPEGFAIQFEMIGPKIQNNPMGLDKHDIYVFNVYDIRNKQYLSYDTFVRFCKKLNLPISELSMPIQMFPEDITKEQLIEWAKGNYKNGKPREGIVIRPVFEEQVKQQRLSFKVINLEYGK